MLLHLMCHVYDFHVEEWRQAGLRIRNKQMCSKYSQPVCGFQLRPGLLQSSTKVTVPHTVNCKFIVIRRLFPAKTWYERCYWTEAQQLTVDIEKHDSTVLSNTQQPSGQFGHVFRINVHSVLKPQGQGHRRNGNIHRKMNKGNDGKPLTVIIIEMFVKGRSGHELQEHIGNDDLH